jgi:hypothetical protein
MQQFDLGIDQLMRRIENFEEVAKAAVRPAAQAMSQVFYDEVKLRALTIGGSQRLQASIYQKFVVKSAADALGRGATYHISWRKGHSENNKKGKAGKGSLPSVTFGYWIEYGHWQRYAVYEGTDGELYTAIRPGMEKKPRPGRYASQAEKDAYFVLRKGGPKQIPSRSFLRSAYDAKRNDAVMAAMETMDEFIKQAKV